MRHISVSSSNLASVGYDPRTGTLQVAFRSGGLYDYYHVPNHVYQALMSASSHGKYHACYIKGRYSYAKRY